MARTPHETIRRVRLGNLKGLLRHRYGHTLPDDDAGRDDLEEVLRLSLDKHLDNVVEIAAPWMLPTEAERLVAHVKNLPLNVRWSTGEALGQRVRLTNAERDALKVWQIAACDVTAEERIELRKAKERVRKRAKRQRVPRSVYLAQCRARVPPWKAEGISKATWYRRKVRAETSVSPDQSQGVRLGVSAAQREG